MSFKSCPRVGGIHQQRYNGHSGKQFQVVPPCGGHLERDSVSRIEIGFQVVPPCGGHLGALGEAEGVEVSSRAPVWGASKASEFVLHFINVSSRAPVWGASFNGGR